MEELKANQRRPRNRKVGVVVSNAMKKSVVVAVSRRVPHSLYKKFVRRTHKFMAHDEENKCKVGDRVEIQETRPLSRRKRWIVREILSRATE
ncbi:MAG: 30S ribosomal protein S17 [Acidobacteria bacterium]|nr:30S ribosomal protein S17 [Acidobacteriota bacterium]